VRAFDPSFASLPDPAEPTIIAFGSAAGAFIAETAVRLRRVPAERRLMAVGDGAFVGAAVATVVYLIAIAVRW
jgi:hypothetical protein